MPPLDVTRDPYALDAVVIAAIATTAIVVATSTIVAIAIYGPTRLIWLTNEE